ncbi:MAG TPA: DUF72 domain-containing protein [Abditibacteriaceae bacterium]|jgi:uncharacterized protein YecE (DUF72 family)
MSIYIGTSGWSYDHWKGVLYPHEADSRERLAYYTEKFGTVEVNSTYYRWPTNSTFYSWRRRVPDGFRLTIKASRALTHSKKLYSPELWIERTTQSLRCLGEKRGVWLVQLPPTFDYDYTRLEYFLKQLPSWLQVAIEFRHPGWNRDDVFHLLEQYGVGYCVMSGAHLPCVLRATAPFVYVRLHGPDWNHLYGGSYSDDDLRWWAERIREWRDAGREVWAYFNNDGGGNAVRNAQTLRHFVGA